jgi:hypothetical protein
LVFDCGNLECKGAPRELWTIRCLSLHNDNGLAVTEGICHNVKFDLVIGSTGLLGDTHVAESKNLNVDEFPDN